MSSDISRQRFDSRHDFSGVLMQQGRVQLDADWNELNEIMDRRWRSETVDIIGRCVVPRETPDGFGIQFAGGVLTIGRGRIYVDGLQAENHGAGDLDFDAILAESRGKTAVRYDEQLYFPAATPLPTTPGPHLVYVDVWQREVTSIEDPMLIENAVGVDTTARTQTVWQVRVLPDVGAGISCATPDDQIPGWLDLTRPSAGRLTTAAVGVATADDPCLVPPSGGYRGLENRLYRVEIHAAGSAGTASFKWSRDNASVATNVSAIVGGNTLTVDRTAWDSARRFSPGDWVEITDDVREFSGAPGEIRRVATVDDATRTITLEAALTAGLFPVDGKNLTDPARHTQLKRWDQSGLVKDSTGALFLDLDAPGGTRVIPVPPPGTSLILEDGVQVTFTTDPAGGAFRVGDYWVFTARTADASVEALDQAPPRGVHHHFGRLALVTLPDTVVDCRTFWPPAAGTGESCDCTVCVNADDHNAGVFTLYQAVDQIRKSGGTICLGPGTFNLFERPVDLEVAFGVRIRGQGAATVLLPPRADAAFNFRHCRWCTLESVTIHTLPSGGKTPAIRLSNALATVFGQIIIGPAGSDAGPLAGFLIEPGFLLLTTIRGCFIRAQFGIAFESKDNAGTVVPEDAPLLLGYLQVERNWLLCSVAGVRIGGAAYRFGKIEFAHNTIALSTVAAIAFAAVGQDEVFVAENDITIEKGDGLLVGGGPMKITGNEIVSRTQTGERGIRLIGTSLKTGLPTFVVSDNRIRGLHGHAISLETHAASARIERNQLRDLLGNGIVMSEGGSADSAVVVDNELTNVATASAATTRAAELAAIELARVTEGLVSGNIISGVGGDAALAAVIAGVRIDASGEVRVSNNTITNVAPVANFSGLAAGVLVFGPLVGIELSENLVRRQLQPGDADNSSWQALRISGLGEAGVTKHAFAGLAGFALEQRIQAINSFGVISRAGTEVAGLIANSLYGYGRTSVAQVLVSGSCRFSDNHCSAGARSVPLAVDLTAASIIASANRVECARDSHGLDMKLGDKSSFTAVGNLTGGPIFINGAVLAGVFQPLNILVP